MAARVPDELPRGLIVISHDVEPRRAGREQGVLPRRESARDRHLQHGWKQYLRQREDDEKRRKRERANAEKKATQLTAQAEKMRAKATKAVAAQNMLKRAERMLDGVEGERQTDRVASLRFPQARPLRQDPLMAEDLSKSYGAPEIFTGVDLATDRGSRVVVIGLNGAGKTTLLRILGGVDAPDTGADPARPWSAHRLLRQEHETLTWTGPWLENMMTAFPYELPGRGPQDPRLLPCSRATTRTSPPGCSPAGRRPASAWPRSSSPAPTCCCWTSRRNADPASREEYPGRWRTGGRRRSGLPRPRRRRGARSRAGADDADAVEDLWNAEYQGASSSSPEPGAAPRPPHARRRAGRCPPPRRGRVLRRRPREFSSGVALL